MEFLYSFYRQSVCPKLWKSSHLNNLTIMENNKIKQRNNSSTAKRNQKSRKVMLSQPYSKNEKGKKAFPKSSKKNSKLATLRRSSRIKSKSSESASVKQKKAKARSSEKEKKTVPKKKSKMIKRSSREFAIKAFNTEAVNKEASFSDGSKTIAMPNQQSSNCVTPEAIIVNKNDNAIEEEKNKVFMLG